MKPVTDRVRPQSHQVGGGWFAEGQLSVDGCWESSPSPPVRTLIAERLGDGLASARGRR